MRMTIANIFSHANVNKHLIIATIVSLWLQRERRCGSIYKHSPITNIKTHLATTVSLWLQRLKVKRNINISNLLLNQYGVVRLRL